MKFLDEYRDPMVAGRLVDAIRASANRRWTLMEVCGGQTHSLLKHGIGETLQDVVELVHGPGCPVCVTPAEAIDFARQLSLLPQVTVVSFGDMLRVPGNGRSLLTARTEGGDVRLAYSPIDAVTMAQRAPDRQIVFFAVGFETTAPSTALAVLQAERLGLTNFSVLTAHVRVLPAMRAILSHNDCRVDGFLAAGHVCAVTGFEEYQSLAAEFHTPIVVTGFEPLDLLDGIRECVRLLELERAEVSNRYSRAVPPAGNPRARELVESVYEVVDAPWRGLGTIPAGGLALRPKWRAFDARQRYAGIPPVAVATPPDCRAGEVLGGRLRPVDCPHFGARCTPETPLGAPMVSSEGACAAYYRYRRGSAPSQRAALVEGANS